MKKVLYFTKSSGFEHTVVHRENGALSFSERILQLTGPRHGIEFTFTKDGSLITADYLKQFDAVMFYTTGNLCIPGKDGNPPITPEGKAALLDAIRSGRLGFIGIHAASDTWHTDEATFPDPSLPRTWRWQNRAEKADPYMRMLGGSFLVHHWQQPATLRIIDPKFPGANALAPAGAETCTCKDEWYSLNDFSHDLHVITALQTKNMVGPPYQRPDFPNTWARAHGKGRVYFTALGHREDVWVTRAFQTLLYGGIAWATRQTDADITPNIQTATPGAWTLPPVCITDATLSKEEQDKLLATPIPPSGTAD